MLIFSGVLKTTYTKYTIQQLEIHLIKCILLQGREKCTIKKEALMMNEDYTLQLHFSEVYNFLHFTYCFIRFLMCSVLHGILI